MHGLFTLATFLALVGLAFGPKAVSWCAAIILGLWAVGALFVAYLVIFERI